MLLRDHAAGFSDAMDTLRKWVGQKRLETCPFGHDEGSAAGIAVDLARNDGKVLPADALVIGAAIVDPLCSVLFSWDRFVGFREVGALAKRHGKRIEELPTS